MSISAAYLWDMLDAALAIREFTSEMSYGQYIQNMKTRMAVGGGDTYEEALADVKSAIQFHIETFGREALDLDGVSETFVAEMVL